MKNNSDLTTLFCQVDDFCQRFEPHWFKTLLETKAIQRQKRKSLCLSEVMTLLIAFHTSGFRNFKQFYLQLLLFGRKDFPGLVSYQRFVEIMPMALMPLCAFFKFYSGKQTGIGIIDSTSIVVCHNKRIFDHKVFEGIAKRGKNSMGWFFGLKLHMIINDLGEILAFKITPANVSDSKMTQPLSGGLTGKLFGDKGYLNHKLFKSLFKRGLQLITQIRSNMKNKLMNLADRMTLRKRSLVESVFHILKDVLHIEHTRHQSPTNAMVNLVAGLAAYCLLENKPKMKRDFKIRSTILIPV